MHGDADRACAPRQVSDQLTELKLGNGTSILITANIASALPTSVGAALQTAATKDQTNLAVYALALFATTLGVVYVQVCPHAHVLAADACDQMHVTFHLAESHAACPSQPAMWACVHEPHASRQCL